MKKNFTYLIIGLVALNTACTDIDNLDLTNENTAPLSINAVAPGNDTRVTFDDQTTTDGSSSSYFMKVNWAAGDNMLLANADASNSCTLTASAAGHSVPFSTPASPYVPAAGEQVFGYFPSTITEKSLTEYSTDGTTVASTTANNYLVDYSAAGGTDPSAIANTAVMYSTNQYGESVPMDFRNATSIIRLKLTFPSQAEANKIDRVELYSANGEFITSACMQVGADESVKWRTPKSGVNTITVPANSGAADGTLTLYTLAIPQENVPEMRILATSSTDKTVAYFAKLNSTPTFNAGGMCGIVKNMSDTPISVSDGTSAINTSNDVWLVYGTDQNKAASLLSTTIIALKASEPSRRIDIIVPDITTTSGNDPFGQNNTSNNSIIKSIYCKNLSSTGNNAFRFLSKLTSINLPKINSFGAWEFNVDGALTSVNFPSATNLNYAGVFNACNNLKKVTLGSKITAIATNAFPTANNIDLFVNLEQDKIGTAYVDTSTKTFGANTKTFKSITRQ